MAKVTAIKALTNYFNVDAGKRPSREWLQEVKALTPEEKRELAELVCVATGDELVASV